MLILAFTAPHKNLMEHLQSRNLLGISSSMTKEIQRKRDRVSDAIVFDGPVNIVVKGRSDDGVIHFPDDVHHNRDDEIDLSWSFTPTNSNISQPVEIIGTYANCGVISSVGLQTAGTAESSVVTYPNGTKIAYSKCQVAQVIKARSGG